MGIQREFKDAKSEGLCAIDTFENIGVVKHVEDCGALLREIEEAASRKMDSKGKFLKTAPLHTPVNSPLSA